MNPFSMDMALRGPGPVAWCKRCSRKHPRRSCDLVQEVRKNRKGKDVIYLVHPKPKVKKHVLRAR